MQNYQANFLYYQSTTRQVFVLPSSNAMNIRSHHLFIDFWVTYDSIDDYRREQLKRLIKGKLMIPRLESVEFLIHSYQSNLFLDAVLNKSNE